MRIPPSPLAHRQPGPPSSARGRILVIVLPLVVLLGGASGAFFFLRGPRPPKAEREDTTYLLALADLSVNLADQDRPHYLMASLGIAISGEDPEQVAAERDPQIRDAVLMVMSRHSYKALLSAEGKQALKHDLSAAVTEALSEDALTVDEVLFTSFVMD